MPLKQRHLGPMCCFRKTKVTVFQLFCVASPYTPPIIPSQSQSEFAWDGERCTFYCYVSLPVNYSVETGDVVTASVNIVVIFAFVAPRVRCIQTQKKHNTLHRNFHFSGEPVTFTDPRRQLKRRSPALNNSMTTLVTRHVYIAKRDRFCRVPFFFSSRAPDSSSNLTYANASPVSFTLAQTNYVLRAFQRRTSTIYGGYIRYEWSLNALQYEDRIVFLYYRSLDRDSRD